MLNVVVVNAPTKKTTVQQFIKSRGVKDFQLVNDATELFQYLMTGTCNVHVFDFFLDMSLINMINDMKESINVLNIYVPDSRIGKPYLTLTDNVSVMPSEVDFLSWFWDQGTCSLNNVLACEAAGKPFYLLNLPQKPMRPKRMLLYISPKKIPAVYANSSGKVIKTKVEQLGVKAFVKGVPITPELATRRQAGIFGEEHRVLDLPQPVEDIPAAPVEEKPVKPKREKPPKPPKPEKVPKPKKEPKPKPEKPAKEPKPEKPVYGKGLDEVVDTNLVNGSFEDSSSHIDTSEVIDTSELDLTNTPSEEVAVEPEVAPEPEVEPEVVKEPEPEPEPEAPKAPRRPKIEINLDAESKGPEKIAPNASRITGLNINRMKISTASTVEDYMVQNGYIDQKTCNELLLEVKRAKTDGKIIRIGDLAAQRGLITLEDLVHITAKVYRMEIIGWDQLESMEVDYSDFTPDRCRQLKFFRTKDDASGNVQIIVSASATTLDSAIRRLYDNPRIRYTLDEYIDKKLEV